MSEWNDAHRRMNETNHFGLISAHQLALFLRKHVPQGCTIVRANQYCEPDDEIYRVIDMHLTRIGNQGGLDALAAFPVLSEMIVKLQRAVYEENITSFAVVNGSQTSNVGAALTKAREYCGMELSRCA